MANLFSRSELILGNDAMQKLAAARVAVFGVGGVGGYVVEALARTGIGALDLIDNDTVCLTELMFTDNDELSGLIARMWRMPALR